LQRVLVAAGEIHDLDDLGLGHLEGEHADHRHALLVHRQHQLEGLRMAHAEEPLEHVHDELHRRVVVVEQQHLVERRALRLGARLGDDSGLTVGVVLVAIGREDRQERLHLDTPRFDVAGTRP